MLLGFQPALLRCEYFHDDIIPAFGARALEMLVVRLTEHEHVLAGGAERFDLVRGVVEVQVC